MTIDFSVSWAEQLFSKSMESYLTLHTYLKLNVGLIDFTHLDELYQAYISTSQPTEIEETNRFILNLAVQTANPSLYLYVKSKIGDLKPYLKDHAYHYLNPIANPFYYANRCTSYNPAIISIARDLIREGGDPGLGLENQLGKSPLEIVLNFPQRLSVAVLFLMEKHTELDPNILNEEQKRMLQKAQAVIKSMKTMQASLKALASNNNSFISWLPGDLRRELGFFYEERTLWDLQSDLPTPNIPLHSGMLNFIAFKRSNFQIT